MQTFFAFSNEVMTRPIAACLARPLSIFTKVGTFLLLSAVLGLIIWIRINTTWQTQLVHLIIFCVETATFFAEKTQRLTTGEGIGAVCIVIMMVVVVIVVLAILRKR